MNRLVHRSLLSAVVATGAIALAACDVAKTDKPAESPEPTPEPTAVYSNDTYVAALRAASLRLRARLPSTADLDNVRANGRIAYEPIIDRYLDPGQNTYLQSQMQGFYQSLFRMAGTISGDTVNYNEPSNLGVYLFLNDRPVQEMMTADYCIGDNLQTTTCSGGTPQDKRAGVVTSQAFLKTYGKKSKFNFRRTSAMHQIFACGVYEDSTDPAKWMRSNVAENLWPCNKGQNAAFESAGASSANGPDGMPGTSDDQPTMNVQPCAGDDYVDPSIIPWQQDGASPRRVSKKYQGLQAGINRPCQTCHGSILPRRLLFTPWTMTSDPPTASDGTYDATRTIKHVEDFVLNANKDYCGLETPGDATDDIDPNAADCAVDAMAEYNGIRFATMREFSQWFTGTERYEECMTIRHYNFALGKSQGTFGLQAGVGVEPARPAQATILRYRLVYESNEWSTRALLGEIFKGSEFLAAQEAQGD